MNRPTELQAAICSKCGHGEDARTGLCLACLMQSATDSQLTPDFDLFADESELPRLGSYALIEEIGRGGMGVIYKARDLHTGRLVAIKKLQDQIAHDPQLLARFRREAQTAANLEHPHILPIYEVNNEADGVPFFTMRLVTGGSLAERRASLQGCFREVAALMAQVAHAVQHAHECGVIHRDLKPGNILLDASGQPLVSDFGLATRLDQASDLTRTIMVFGTPGYLPPEYLQGRPEVLNPASDIYSLGVILFELLAGRLPRSADLDLAALRTAAERPAPKLRTFVPAASRDLEVICARCLEFEPALRYATAGALAADLEHWLCGRPIIARPVPLVVRGWKLVRRHPAISIASLLCAALLASGLVLNHFREKTAADLVRATGYDRTLAVLPIEDLDRIGYTSPTASNATRACLEGAQIYSPKLTCLAVAAPIELLPQHGELIRLSRKLSARYFLSGTVRQQGEAVRLVLHLTDAVTDTKLKTEVIETATATSLPGAPALRSFFANLAQQGGDSGTTTNFAGANSPTQVLAANYIQAGGRHMERRNPEDIAMAIEAFGRAVKEEPQNAVALSALARAMALRSQLGDRELWLDRALASAQEAMKAAPHLVDSHRALFFVYNVSGDVVHAQQQALEAFELQPENANAASSVAEGMCNLGALDLALRWNQKAIARQTFADDFCIQRGDFLTALACFDRAREVYREFADFRPELPDGPMGLAHLNALSGRTANALKDIRALHARFPNQPILTQTLATFEFQFGDTAVAEQLFIEHLSDEDWGLYAYLGARGISVLGCITLRHDEEKGRQLVERALALDLAHLAGTPRDPSLLTEKAANLALLHRPEEAITALRCALTGGLWTYHQMQIDPRMASLRSRPDFLQLIEATAKRLQIFRENLNLESESKN